MHGNIIEYIYGIADNTLILGQRLSELCGSGPTLETDIAVTNIALDLLGQTRGYYRYVAQLHVEEVVTEDTIAFLRKENQYKNALLVEMPNYDFAYIIVRALFFDTFHLMFLQKLHFSENKTLSILAERAIKEVSYHLRFSSDWFKRLGDGTEESHQKIKEAVNELWPYTDELFFQTENDKILIAEGIGVETTALKKIYREKIGDIMEATKIVLPEISWFQNGGKQGVHTEYFGYLLSDMQFMQRVYPDLKW